MPEEKSSSSKCECGPDSACGGNCDPCKCNNSEEKKKPSCCGGEAKKSSSVVEMLTQPKMLAVLGIGTLFVFFLPPFLLRLYLNLYM